MVIIILVALIILGIASFQVVQGLFSATITTILTVLSALLAFSYYEVIAAELFYKTGYAVYADAGVLVLLFCVPLLLLRFLFDRMLVPGTVNFGIWANRIGGGLMGLISGMVAMGVLTTAIQALPWGQTVLTYRPFNEKRKECIYCGKEVTPEDLKLMEKKEPRTIICALCYRRFPETEAHFTVKGLVCETCFGTKKSF